MYMIYWSEVVSDELHPRSKLFDSTSMTDALQFAESLRKRKYGGELVYFIVMSSENPDCVGKQGVDVTDSTYDWKKRR